jgi:FixJ family two-component response regulator
MDRVKAPNLFIDRDLAGSDWREAMSRFASLSSRTCIVLVSRVVDVYLWNEVVRYGGYEVLAKPLRRDDVSRAVRLAWFYWSTAARSSAAAKPFARR